LRNGSELNIFQNIFAMEKTGRRALGQMFHGFVADPAEAAASRRDLLSGNIDGQTVSYQKFAAYSKPGYSPAGFLHLLPLGKDIFSAQFFAFAARRRPFPRGIISRFRS
jgi:hypothetical protein